MKTNTIDTKFKLFLLIVAGLIGSGNVWALTTYNVNGPTDWTYAMNFACTTTDDIEIIIGNDMTLSAADSYWSAFNTTAPSITIKSNGVHKTITAGAAGYQFLKAGPNVTIEDITIIGFSFTGDGGAISVSDGNTLTLNNVTFENNSATGNGGAVFMGANANVTIQNTVQFIGNTSGYTGGAISSWVGATMTIDSGAKVISSNNNSSFDGLDTYGITITNNGNGIEYIVTTGASADFVNVVGTLANAMNKANNAPMLNIPVEITFASGVQNLVVGGQLPTISGSRTQPLTIDGGVSGVSLTRYFNSDGYRCFDSENDLILRNLTINDFQFNTAVTEGGGAVYFHGPGKTLTLDNVIFSQNQCNADGGAIHMRSGNMNIEGTVTFAGNVSGSWGGAFYAENTASVELTKNGTIILGSGNSSFEDGPVKFDADGTVICKVTSNLHGLSLGTLGWAIARANSSPDIPLTITFDPAVAYALVEEIEYVLNDRSEPLTIDGSGGSGGQVNIENTGNYRFFTNNITNSTLTLKKLTIKDFEPETKDGAVISNNGKLVVEDVVFDNNNSIVSGQPGSIIYCYPGSNIELGNATFTSNGTLTNPLRALIYLDTNAQYSTRNSTSQQFGLVGFSNVFAPTEANAVWAYRATQTYVLGTAYLDGATGAIWYYYADGDIYFFLVTNNSDSDVPNNGSLRDCITRAIGDPGRQDKVVVIEFDPLVTNIQLLSSLPIIASRTNDLIIDGKCAVTIVGGVGSSSDFRCFENTLTSADFILQGLTITEFRAKAGSVNKNNEGSAIYNDVSARLILENVNFTKNECASIIATDSLALGYGGTVHATTGSFVTIRKRVLFEENRSETFGGGMTLDQASLTIETGSKAIFLKNYAKFGGGGIYTKSIDSPSDYPLIVNWDNAVPYTDVRKPLIFTANSTEMGLFDSRVSAEDERLFLLDGDAVTHLKGARIRMGGAFYHEGKQPINVKHAAFTSNKSLIGGGFATGNIEVNEVAEINMVNVLFSGNSVVNEKEGGYYKAQGGGAYVQGKFTMDDNSNFSGNSAENEGGGIFYFTNQPITEGVNFAGTFKNNMAKDGGGIMTIAQNNAVNTDETPKVTVSLSPNGVYENNHATGGNGGFLSVSQMRLDIIGTYSVSGGDDQRIAFRNNTAEYMGGAIYVFAGNTVNITNARFLNNMQRGAELPPSDPELPDAPVLYQEGNGGGAIAILGEDRYTLGTGGISVPTTLNIKNVYFEKNEANKGGAIGTYGTNFANPGDCDKIVINDGSDDFTRFVLNKAVIEDGEATLDPLTGEYVLINKGRGGAIYSMGEVHINTAKGTATDHASGDVQDAADNSHFYDNSGGAFGGAICSYGSVDIQNQYFYQNRANSGGGIYLNLAASTVDGGTTIPGEAAVITNSLFKQHLASYGASVLLEHLVGDLLEDAGTLTSVGSIYKDGRSSSGAAIHATYPEQFDLRGNTFTNNQAKGADGMLGTGGAVAAIGGRLNVTDHNVFTENYALAGAGTGAAIYTTAIINIANNDFFSNVAGVLETINETDTIISGAVVAIGSTVDPSKDNATTGFLNQIVGNTIENNKNADTPYPNPDYNPTQPLSSANPETISLDMISHGVGFIDLFETRMVNDEETDVQLPAGQVLVKGNTIQGNNIGVHVTPYVQQVEITQNTFGGNAKSIDTGQRKFRHAADSALIDEKGNWGIGYPAVLKASNEGVREVAFSRGLNPGIQSPAHTARIELYESSEATDDSGTATIKFIGTIVPDADELASTYIDRSTPVQFIEPLVANPENIFALAIDAMGNTSELGGRGAAVTIHIDDVAGSGIDWDEAEFMGNWTDDFYFNNSPLASYLLYPGEDLKMTAIEGETDKYTGTFFVINSNPYDEIPPGEYKWRVALKTAGGKRFGDWSFDGTAGDEINMETYRVMQNYNFETALATNTRVEDFKLLAIADGSAVNRLRNNEYLSMDNDLSEIPSGNTGGGGGLLIKRNPEKTLTQTQIDEGMTIDDLLDPDVELTGTSPVIGSPANGQLRTGFLVVDKDADFIVNGNQAYLYMEDEDSNIGSWDSKAYGPRLIIEKEAESSGIFAITGGGHFGVGGNFMAMYHHQLDENAWSWLGLPSPKTGFAVDIPMDKMLYTASSPDDKFTLNTESETDPVLVSYYYDQMVRASVMPEFYEGGTAWQDTTVSDAKNGRILDYKIHGLIASVNGENSPKDLYMEQSIGSFSNMPQSFITYYNACTVPGQVAAAASYLQTPDYEHGYSGTAQELADLYHSGWNLIGNPYSQSLAPTSAFGSVIALPINNEDGTNTYAYWNLDGTIVLGYDTHNSTTSEFPGERWAGFNIPPLTSFFVQTIGSENGAIPYSMPPSFSLKNELSKGTEVSEYEEPHGPQYGAPRSPENKPGIVRLTLLKNDKPVSQTVLSFREGATPVIDKGYDAIMMGSNGTDVYLLDGMNFPMAINVINKEYTSISVPVGLNIATAGKYTFRFSEVSNIEGELSFVDNEGETMVISEGLSYPFTIKKGNDNVARFVINGSKASNPGDGVDTSIDSSTQLKKPYVFVRNQNEIVVTGISSSADILLVDISGKVLHLETSAKNECVIPVSNRGVYVVKIIYESRLYTYKVTL